MKVICITNQTAFPNGEACVSRIILIGKALIKAGNSYTVVSACFNKNKFNKSAKGEHEGIKFYHSNILWERPKSIIIRYLFAVAGIINIVRILYLEKEKDCIIHIYSQGTFFNLIIQVYSIIFGIKTIQEVNEWDYDVRKGLLKEWFYKNTMFKLSHGAIAISGQIAQNVKLYCRANFDVIQVPILADSDKFKCKKPIINNYKYGLWMGLVDGYIKDVEFIANGLIQSFRLNNPVKIFICGRFSIQSKQRIENLLSENHVPLDSLVFKGYLSNVELLDLCKKASFFIAPLWRDQKSENRFPTKIATFMFCRKVVITSSIGEVTKYLSDKYNCLFIDPNDHEELARQMIWIENNNEKSLRIGTNAYKTALTFFDYNVYSQSLSSFLTKVNK